MTVAHACAPGQFCGLCDHNVRSGGSANHPSNLVRPKTPPARKSLPARGPCLFLGKRTEFRPGCGGRLCAHVCEAGEPVAVPGGVCLTCPKWESETAT